SSSVADATQTKILIFMPALKDRPKFTGRYALANLQKLKRTCTSIRRLPDSVPPAADVPLLLPKPKPPARVFDCPKSGELRFPMTGPKFTWLSRLCARTETTRLYRLSVTPPVEVPPDSDPNTLPSPPRSAVLRLPPSARSVRCAVGERPLSGGGAEAVAPRRSPKPNTFVSRRWMSKKLGPVPKLRGINGCPADGFGSKAPKRV